MAWKLKIFFSDGNEELVDEDFDTEEEAEEEYREWLENWDAGRETLELAGEPYSDAEIIDYEIWEE